MTTSQHFFLKLFDKNEKAKIYYKDLNFNQFSSQELKFLQNLSILSKYKDYIKEFKENKIKLPTVNLEHCSGTSISNFLGFNSLYSYLDNKIKICINQINNYDEVPAILNKELIYAYDNLIKYKDQNISLNNHACTAIRACR